MVAKDGVATERKWGNEMGSILNSGGLKLLGFVGITTVICW